MGLFRTFIFVLTLFGLVGAQAENPLAGLPGCALSCVASLVPQSSCSITDLPCICTNEPLFNSIAACTQANCTVKQTLTTTNSTLAACGVPRRDHSNIQVVLAILFCVIAVCASILRLIARPPFTTKFGIDDGLILLAVAPTIPLTVLDVIAAKMGLGRDIWTVEFQHLDTILRYYYVNELLYVWIATMTKISMLFFYLRIFPHQGTKLQIRVVMGMCICYAIAFVPVIIFQCKPISYFWRQWSGELSGTCINSNAMVWSMAAINIVLDLLVISLPIPRLLKISTTTGRKLQLVLMFSLGFFITIVSIIRLQTLVKFSKSTNLTWDFLPVGYWSSIEVDVSVLCACLPAIASLLPRIMPKWFGSTANSAAYQKQVENNSGKSGESEANSARKTKKIRRWDDLDTVNLVTIDQTSKAPVDA